MRILFYTLQELVDIKNRFNPVELDKRAKLQKLVNRMAINENLALIRNLQESLAQHNKFISLNAQMDIVRIIHMIEKLISPRMYVWYRKHIKERYPNISEEMACRLANEKVTKCFAKYRY